MRSSKPGAEQTLLEALKRRAEETPTKSAFHWKKQRHSYRRLWAAIQSFAADLLEEGLQPGERVMVALPNGPDFFTAFYGIQLGGGIPVPVSPDSGEPRIADLAAVCGASSIVRPPGHTSDLPLRRLTAGSGGVPGRPFPEITPDSTAYLQFTSGTTGDPKAVIIRHIDLYNNIRQMISGMEITREDIFVSWLPAYHDMGLVLMTMIPFYLGAQLFLLPTSFVNLRAWFRTIESVRGTFTASPDFGYRLAMRYTTGQAPPDLASLRVALNAAEPVRKTTVRDFESMFGLERVMTVGYGLAEATVGVSMTKPGGIVQVDPDGFASCGRPFPRVELRILKPDGALGTVGETGEILVRSPANTQGYFNDPDAGRRLFWDAGFIRTGDIGYLDRDGELYVIGRSKDMLKHAGRTYAPREIEAALDDVPGVRRAVAVSADLGGLPGEQIILFCEIEKSGRLDKDSLHALTVDLVARVHAHAGLRPGRLYLVRPKTVPLSPNGKVQRSRLRTAFLDGRLRASARIVYPDF